MGSRRRRKARGQSRPDIATPAAVHPVGTFPAEQLWARIPFQLVWTIFRGGGGDSTQLSSRPVLPKPCSRFSDSQDLAKPGCQLKETSIRKKIQRWLSPPFLEDLIQWRLESENGRWHLQFDFNGAGFQKILTHRLGRTMLVTPHLDWTAEQVVAAYSGQQRIEQVFRGLKDGDWLGWGPMYHWTDTKILGHAFYCMVGVSLRQYMYQQALTAC